MRFPVEIVRRTRELVGDGLPDRLPDLAARPGRGRPDLGRGRRARAPARGGRRHRAQHRHRLARGAGADDHHPGPARAPGARRPPGSRPRSSVPVCASNRINTPELAEEILAAGEADLVSMARPLLADPDFVAKAAAGRADEINTCIACNQACLDHVVQQPARRPAWSTRAPAARPRWCSRPTPARSARVAVVGAGPAGLAAAVSAAERGFAVTLFEKVRRARRPVPAGDGGARQGGLRRDAALLRPPARGPRRRRAARHRGHRGRPRGVRRGGRRHRRGAADARARRHRPPEGGVVRRRAERRGRARASGSR